MNLQFPQNIVLAVADAIKAWNPAPDEDTPYVPGEDHIEVFMRPLRNGDPRVSAGVYASSWNPNEQSYEMGTATLGGGRQEATLNQYTIAVQTLIVHTDEVEGLTRSSIVAKRARDTLLRNPTVGVQLTQLSATDSNGLTERVMRRWVKTQRFISNELRGSFTYLSVLELTIETETF
jgi:hypothetical protein